METRKHYFKENNLTVISFSENIRQFDNYILCFKREYLNDKNRLFYWCSKNELEFQPHHFQLIIIGKTDEDNRLKLHPINLEETTVTVPMSKPPLPSLKVEVEKENLVFEE
jgi:hypothetical protein